MGETVVPDCTIPGTPSYVKATVEGLKCVAKFVDKDARPVVRYAGELRECNAWEVYFEDEPKTWDRLCREAIGYDPDFIAAIEAGVAILESRGRTGEIPSGEAIAALADGAPQQAAEADSRIGAGRGNKTVANGNHFKKGQNNANYLTRRIARNHPEILERMKAGEFSSVRAAALEAGIVKPTFTCPLEPRRAARLIAKHFSGEQLTQLIELLVATEAEA